MGCRVAAALMLVGVLCLPAGCRNQAEPDVVIGLAQKGPFLAGASVVVHQLDTTLQRTGRSVNAQVGANAWFAVPLGWSGPTEVVVSGHYFNELTGQASTSPVTLACYGNVDGRTRFNVNILCHLASARVAQRMHAGAESTLNAALDAAGGELRDFFELPAGTLFSELDLTDGGTANAGSNAVLLLLSSALQAVADQDPLADLPELLEQLAVDFSADGQIDASAPLCQALADAARGIDLARLAPAPGVQDAPDPGDLNLAYPGPVAWLNLLPVADAGVDQVVDEGSTVMLHGDLSDPDGAVAAVQWTQTAGPAVVLGGADGPDAYFIAPDVDAEQRLSFQLTVIDDQGAVASDTVDIDVAPLWRVGGNLGGLSGALVLQNNAGDDLLLSANGAFAFSVPAGSGEAYAVTVRAQPDEQLCVVANAAGTVGTQDVSDIEVSCGPIPLTISGVSPARGFYPGGLTVSVTGTGFNDATEIAFGGVPCASPRRLSGTLIECETPRNGVATVNLMATRGSDVASADGAFTYTDFTRISTIAGSGVMGAADGSGDVAQFGSSLNGLRIEGDTLYVADGGNFRLRMVDISALDSVDPQRADVTVATLAGSGTQGNADSSDGTGASARFQQPDDVGAQVGNRLYVSDTDWATMAVGAAGVRVIELPGGGTTTLLAGQRGSAGLAWDGSRYLYLADCSGTDTIRRIDTSDGTVIDFAGSPGTAGNSDGIGADARFNCPYGVVLDAAGENLYVADWNNNKIRRVHIPTQAVTSIAGSGVAGHIDHADGGQARFNGPSKLVWINDWLFVTDWSNCALRRIDLGSLEVSTIAGSAALCGGADGPLATATLGAVIAIAYDPRFGIFFASGDWRYAAVAANARIRLLH